MDDIEKKIVKARIKLFFDQPFFGNLTMGMKLVDSTESGWCPTAATDGRSIYYNKKFFNDLSLSEIVFVLCHEVLHVAFDHLGRRSHRDPEYWNMANDYVINDMLMVEKIGTMPTKAVEDPKERGKETSQRVGLYNAKYHGWSSEKVYEDLKKRQVKKELTLDVHLELGNDGKKKSDNNGGNEPGMTVEISEEDLKKIREDMRARVIQAAQAAQAAGKLPASIARMVNDLVDPVIDWRELLKQNIQSCITDDFSWQRPNRRHMYGGIFMPTLKKDETVDLAVAVDMSGSITNDMANDFLSEIHGIMTSYPDFKISVLCFDTKPYGYEEFTPDNSDDLLSYECKGGGGTDFNAFWDYWKEHDIEPKKAVIFTDGYPNGDWGPPNYCDTLWIVTEGQKTRIVPPFGEYAYFTSNEGVTEVGHS